MTYRQWTKSFADRLYAGAPFSRRICNRIAERQWHADTAQCPREAADDYLFRYSEDIRELVEAAGL